ncbi:MAG: carbohydrate kinase family protein [Clostridiales bacterium]|nr:carbohydrate kinase family protein [Clostridiales bacterium]
MKYFISGLVNVETNLRIRSFPVAYYPIDYPFFGIDSSISGVGYNISMAAKTLGDEITLSTLIGKDNEADRIRHKLDEGGISREYVFETLDCTPVSIILYEPGDGGRRQIYCDLKNIQDMSIDAARVENAIRSSDICVLCNTNFNRPLLPMAKAAGKTIATDVHVISDIYDPFNRDFMEYADILFLSDEDLPVRPEQFLTDLKNTYKAKIIAIGLGSDGVIFYERDTDTITRLPACQIGGVANTVGAGDALFTAFNHYYFNGCSATEAMKRAEIFAALKIRHAGGGAGFPTEQQVQEIYTNYEFK